MPAFRPQDDAERGQCLDAVAHLEGLTDLNETIAHVFDTFFAPARARFQATSLEHAMTKARWETARKEAAAADKRHDKAFRLWTGTVRSEEEGTEIPREIASALGVLPGRFVELPYREEVTKAKHLFDQITQRPEIAGDPVKLAAFRTAHQALAVKVAAGEKARSAKIKARKSRVAAARVLDRTYMLLVRTLHEAEGPDQTLCELPVFRRTGPPASTEDEDKDPLELTEGEEIDPEDSEDNEPGEVVPVPPPRSVAVTSPPESA